MPDPTYPYNMAESETATAAKVMGNFNYLKTLLKLLDTINLTTNSAYFSLPISIRGLIPVGTDDMTLAGGVPTCALWRHRSGLTCRLVHVSARCAHDDVLVSVQYSADGTFAAPVELLTGGLATVPAANDPAVFSGASVNSSQQIALGGRLRLRTALVAPGDTPGFLQMVLGFKALLSTNDGALA